MEVIEEGILEGHIKHHNDGHLVERLSRMIHIGYGMILGDPEESPPLPGK